MHGGGSSDKKKKKKKAATPPSSDNDSDDPSSGKVGIFLLCEVEIVSMAHWKCFTLFRELFIILIVEL